MEESAMALVQMRADARTQLRVYLNDHLAGATAGRDLAARCAGRNRGTPLGAFLTELLQEIIEDRAVLERLIVRLGMPIATPKLVFAALLERAGRFKLNGQLVGYSDLARLVELEALCSGVDAKACLWLSLQQLDDPDPVMADVPLDELIARAARQRAGLEEHRQAAARQAFTA
jgi:hypothetical protein